MIEILAILNWLFWPIWKFALYIDSKYFQEGRIPSLLLFAETSDDLFIHLRSRLAHFSWPISARILTVHLLGLVLTNWVRDFVVGEFLRPFLRFGVILRRGLIWLRDNLFGLIHAIYNYKVFNIWYWHYTVKNWNIKRKIFFRMAFNLCNIKALIKEDMKFYCILIHTIFENLKIKFPKVHYFMVKFYALIAQEANFTYFNCKYFPFRWYIF